MLNYNCFKKDLWIEANTTDETSSSESSHGGLNVAGTTVTVGHGLTYHFTAEAEI